MKNYLLVALLGGLVLFVSCKEDEEPIDPIVAKWELDKVEYSDPAAGSVWLIFGSGDISLWGESSYELELLADGTYERELTFSNGRAEDSGEWEKDGDELELDQEESDINDLFTDFEISSSTTDELVLIASDNSWPSLTTDFLEDFLATEDTITSDESYGRILDANTTFNSIEITLTFEK